MIDLQCSERRRPWQTITIAFCWHSVARRRTQDVGRRRWSPGTCLCPAPAYISRRPSHPLWKPRGSLTEANVLFLGFARTRCTCTCTPAPKIIALPSISISSVSMASVSLSPLGVLCIYENHFRAAIKPNTVNVSMAMAMAAASNLGLAAVQVPLISLVFSSHLTLFRLCADLLHDLQSPSPS